MTRPPIGQPRVYEPGQHVVVYPGEQVVMEAYVTHEEAALTARTGFPIDISGRARAQVTPMPGWYGAYLRGRFRVFGDTPPALPLVFALNLLSLLFWTMGWSSTIGLGLSSTAFAVALYNLARSNWRRQRAARVLEHYTKGGGR